jgi:hypothetical protein
LWGGFVLSVIASYRRLSACLSDLRLDGVHQYPVFSLRRFRRLALLKVGASQFVFRHRHFILGSCGALERQPHGRHGRQMASAFGQFSVFSIFLETQKPKILYFGDFANLTFEFFVLW